MIDAMAWPGFARISGIEVCQLNGSEYHISIRRIFGRSKSVAAFCFWPRLPRWKTMPNCCASRIENDPAGCATLNRVKRVKRESPMNHAVRFPREWKREKRNTLFVHISHGGCCTRCNRSDGWCSIYNNDRQVQLNQVNKTRNNRWEWCDGFV